jgi:hypothetical protein
LRTGEEKKNDSLTDKLVNVFHPGQTLRRELQQQTGFASADTWVIESP